MSKRNNKLPRKSDVKNKRRKRIPNGRTLTTNDNFLGRSKTGSTKERPVVVIESNDYDELAVVPLSSRNGRNRTRLPNYQQGKSYYKHFVEIEDDEGKPIKVNKKFRENHKNMDVSEFDVRSMRNVLFKHSTPMIENQKKMKIFRKKKNPRD